MDSKQPKKTYPSNAFARFDEPPPPPLDENGRPTVRYPAPRIVGNIIHQGCVGLVLAVGKSDYTEEAGHECWVDDWQCKRCGLALQGHDCKSAYTDRNGELEIDSAKIIGKGRR